ncbi:MAG: hypothetical protein PHE43_02425 [Candidatus Nanoarchaeia archaeon]|nr:hypothetical protein [Candidatus Nanoarchaeia archaeon]
MDIDPLINNWKSMGVFDVLTPFFLVFAFVFAILSATKILGGKKNLDLIVAIVFGALFISNKTLVGKLNSVLPNVALLVIGALVFLFIFLIFSKGKMPSGAWLAILVIIGLIFFVVSFMPDFKIGNTAVSSIGSEKFLGSIDWGGAIILLTIVLVIIVFLKNKPKK